MRRSAAQKIELIPDEDDPEVMRLQLVILESLVIRRDILADTTQGSTRTRLLVKDGDEIEPGAVVTRTEILSKDGGIVGGIHAGAEVLRRLLVVRDADQITIPLELPPGVAVNLQPGQEVINNQLKGAGALFEPPLVVQDLCIDCVNLL